MIRPVLWFVCTIVVTALLVVGGPLAATRTGFAAESDAEQSVSGLSETSAAGSVHELVAGLSDEQVRRLLIDELQKTTRFTKDQGSLISSGFFTGMLERLERVYSVLYWRIVALHANYAKVPHDIGKAVGYLTDGGGILRFGQMIGIVLLIFAGALGIEKLLARLFFSRSHWNTDTPPMGGLFKFWGAVLKALPDFIGIFIWTVLSLGTFLALYGTSATGMQALFMGLLSALLAARVLTTLSRMLCSPSDAALRLVPMDDQAAGYLHRSIALFSWVFSLGMTVILLLKYAGMWGDSFILLIVFFGTGVAFMIAVMIWEHRAPVGERIRGCQGDQCDGGSWFLDRFAAVWHLLALGYLFIVWMLWSGRLIIMGPRIDRAFVVSLLIVPIYLFLDSVINRIATTIADSLEKAQESAEQDTEAAAEGGTRRTVRRIFRIIIIITLFVWLLNLWGFPVPLGRDIVDKGFHIFITLVLSYFFWQLINRLISRKLAAGTADEEISEEEQDEWGGASTQDRSQTFLPIIRKFVGSVTVILVALIILSDLGINIAPLLAGAGVAGLAIGFGAQKLVSDVLSGIFFLIDDAFRVGEYIQAGKVSGVVEAITLRNVMLRHHRGMLQIVPFSDLGAITNFMRGGIVVKFNLQFPYDTDINKVRKIIKKVGKEMLADPEFGADFIKPVKSQGVREVGDSVMTIRVKFTAKPGTHFVIRREAYRKITEALEAKGVHYAHRKVIVEVAETQSSEGHIPGTPPAASQTDTALKGAAAAAGSILAERPERKS